MGQYTCSASNSEGVGESNVALLEIQCEFNGEFVRSFSLDYTNSKFLLKNLFPPPFVHPQMLQFVVLDKFRDTM